MNIENIDEFILEQRLQLLDDYRYLLNRVGVVNRTLETLKLSGIVSDKPIIPSYRIPTVIVVLSKEEDEKLAKDIPNSVIAGKIKEQEFDREKLSRECVEFNCQKCLQRALNGFWCECDCHDKRD